MSSVRPPCCSIRPFSWQGLGQAGQPLERAGRVVAELAAHLVDVDLVQRVGRGGRGEELLHPVELTELAGHVGGVAEAHRVLAPEPVGLAPARARHRLAQVAGQALHLPAQVHVLEQRVGQRLELLALLGRQRAPHRLGRRHPLGQLLEQLVEGGRVAREHVAVLLHELLEGRVELLAPGPLLEHAC